jgi:hypothetical protein
VIPASQPVQSAAIIRRTTGLSVQGTNCVLETSAGSAGPAGNGFDFRSTAYLLVNNSEQVTFSVDYNIWNTSEYWKS